MRLGAMSHLRCRADLYRRAYSGLRSEPSAVATGSPSHGEDVAQVPSDCALVSPPDRILARPSLTRFTGPPGEAGSEPHAVSGPSCGRRDRR
jgi:hypothetical protein